MIITIVVLLIIAAVAVVAFRSYRKTLAEGCCGAGGGGKAAEAEEKKLEGPVVAQRTVVISGMSCINCQNRIQNRLNKIDGLSASVDYKAGRAVVKMDREVSDAAIRTAIVQLGYEVESIG